jgi:hypothetical protein
MYYSLRCKNTYVNKEGKQVTCNHVLASLPGWVLGMLRNLEGDPEGKLVFFCRSCKASRFAEIKFVDGKLTFEALLERPDFGKPLEFGEIVNVSEAPIIGGCDV